MARDYVIVHSCLSCVLPDVDSIFLITKYLISLFFLFFSIYVYMVTCLKTSLILTYKCKLYSKASALIA